MRTLLALVLATGVLATGTLTTAATAQQTAPSPAPTMPMRGGGMGMGGGGMAALLRADTNGDGVITREEAIAAADARFAALDTNHDGTLSAEELRAGMPPRPQGADAPPMPPMQPITREQYHDRALRPFDRIDTNHDGKIDQAELSAYRAMMQERRQERQAGTPASGQQ